jgi:hypothetical protein
MVFSLLLAPGLLVALGLKVACSQIYETIVTHNEPDRVRVVDIRNTSCSAFIPFTASYPDCPQRAFISTRGTCDSETIGWRVNSGEDLKAFCAALSLAGK